MRHSGYPALSNPQREAFDYFVRDIVFVDGNHAQSPSRCAHILEEDKIFMVFCDSFSISQRKSWTNVPYTSSVGIMRSGCLVFFTMFRDLGNHLMA